MIHARRRLFCSMQFPPVLLVIGLLCWWSCCISVVVTVSAFSPAPLGLGAIFLRPSGIKTRPSGGDDAILLEAADFFTDAFWTAKIGGAKELTDRQRRSLYLSQLAEFRRRYGKGKRNQSELFLCENARGELMGVAAMEVESIPESSLRSRTIMSMRAPLMSNVAVSRKFRRRGIAEELVKQVELYARKQWGCQEMYLYVEERNKPAIRLYQKLGYKTFWVDPTATTLTPTEMGGMQNVPTTIVCMRKRLGSGVFGRLFG